MTLKENVELKFYLKRSEPRNPGNKQVLSLYRDYGVIPKDSRDDNHNVTSEDTSNYKYVKKGDFVINKMKAWQGSVAVSDYEGIVSPAYYVYKFTNQELNVKYFHYLLRSSYKEEFKRVSAGIRIGQWDLSSDDLEHSQILIPPLADQQEIANVLDEKLSNIDSVIDKTKQSITKLEEYKKSLITQAVTKGLDPNVERKDSGVEWIGEIPKHWNLQRLKFFFEFGKGLSITKDKLTETGLYILNYGQIHSKDNFITSINCSLIKHFPTHLKEASAKLRIGDFVFADTSEDLDGCGNFILVDKDNIYAGSHTIILKNKTNNLPGYLAYLFMSDAWRAQLRSSVCGIKVYSITQKLLSSTKVIMPTKAEQLQISEFLDEKVSTINKLISRKQSIINKLEEYKKSLIFEYVTGKKSVEEI